MKYREIQEYLLEGSITIEKSLEPYKDDPSMYISYTELDKIGINPQSEYLTPNGVYAYPLKEIWEDLIDDKIPFASNAKYVNLIKSDHVCDLGGVGNYPYTESMLERDKKNIEKIYGPYVSKDELNIILTRPPKFGGNSPGSIFFSATYYLSNILKRKPGFGSKSTLIWNNILRKLGYNSFSDKKGLSILHTGTPYASVFLNSNAYKVIGRFMNKKETRKDLYLPTINPKEFKIISDMNNYFNNIYDILKDVVFEIKSGRERKEYAISVLKDNRNPFMYVYKNIDNILKGESNKFITITNKDEFLRSMNQENIKEFRDIMDRILRIFNIIGK